MFKMTIKRHFDAGHQLPDSEHLVTKACARLHGHSYLCEVSFLSEDNKKGGMVVDFKAIKNIIDELDHQFINDVFKKNGFLHESTAENIAKYIHKRINEEFNSDVEFYLIDLEVGIAEGYKGLEYSSWVWYK